MCIRPLTTAPMWRAWQLSPPTTGLMHSDHRQPGSNVKRAALPWPKSTTSTLVLSGARVSSGESKLFTVRFAISVSLGPVLDDFEIDERRWAVEHLRRSTVPHQDDALQTIRAPSSAMQRWVLTEPQLHFSIF